MTQQEFLSRRRIIGADAAGQRGADFAAPEAVRSADSEYPYRQNSDFGTSPASTNRKRCWC